MSAASTVTVPNSAREVQATAGTVDGSDILFILDLCEIYPIVEFLLQNKSS